MQQCKKILQCSQHVLITNQAITDSCKKSEEAENGQVEIRISIPFVSDAIHSDLDKDKKKLIDVT